MKFIHERYALHRSLTRENAFNRNHTDMQRINFSLVAADSFRTTALECETRMVYTVSDGEEIVYVGEGYTDLKSRMNRGFTPRRYYERTQEARGGYKGYKWIDLLKPVDAKPLTVDVFMFGEAYNDKDSRQIIEAVEGELVYYVRNKTSQWPKYQNEIHFSNQEGAFEVAQEIYQTITGNEKD